MTMDLIDDDIEILRVHPLDLGDLLSNTQAVERNVKNVTAAAAKVVGQEKRDEYIFNMIDSRKKNPNPNSVKNFKL